MRLDRLLLDEKLEASLSVQVQVQVQPQEEDGASRIQPSRDGSGGGGGRGRSVSRARPSWLRRALGGLLVWKQHPAAPVEEAPARARELERAPTERPRWRSSLKKAVGSALARVCKPVCSGVRDDDVVDPRGRRRRRRRRRRGARSGAVLAGESDDDYWTFAFRGKSASLTDEALMRRFEVEEDAMRRRMEIRAAAGLYWSPPGPSRLSQMSLANDDDNGRD